MGVAAHRFSNKLRYRDPGDPANTQFTPAYVLGPVREALGGQIGLDPCTTPGNPVGADRFYTAADDGLASPWRGPGWPAPSVFVNPPYGKAREPWATKCSEAGLAGQQVVLLIPSHTDTLVFHQALTTATSVCFIRGRVKFGTPRANGRQVGASHPSVLIGWNVGLEPCRELGTVLKLSRDGAQVLF